MSVTLSEAEKLTGASVAALRKAIKRGRMSASKDENGQWVIDPVELFRVYQPLSSTVSTDQDEPRADPEPVSTSTLNPALHYAETRIRELEQERDFLRMTVDRLTRLLPAPASQTTPALSTVQWVLIISLVIAMGGLGWAIGMIYRPEPVVPQPPVTPTPAPALVPESLSHDPPPARPAPESTPSIPGVPSPSPPSGAESSAEPLPP